MNNNVNMVNARKKIAVIGAGISGISIASILNDTFDVTVFEQHSHIGGLVHCDRSEGYLYHRVGGHVFNSKNQEVLDWFWSKFDKQTEFIQAKRNAKIFYKGDFIGYPIENFLYQFEPNLVEKILQELIDINRTGTLDAMQYNNFEEFLKGNFGNTLYDLYFKPYNQKIWKTDLSTVSMQWLDGKLPMPKLLEILTSNVSRKEEASMVHASFFYPKQGGSQFIADRIAKGLAVESSKPIDDIKIAGDKKIIFGREFDEVVFTADVRKLPAILSAANGEKHFYNKDILELRSNGTSSVLCECDPNDLSWLYIPESTYKAHRIIYTGNFSPANNSLLGHRSSCTVEFSGICSYEEMTEELKALPGNLKPIAFNNEPNSYVIQDSKTRGLIQEYKDYLSTFGVHLLGRFAEWEYYNMDKAMEAAFRLQTVLINKR